MRSLSTWLCLIAMLVVTRAFSLYQPTYGIAKPPSDAHYFIAPELFRNHSFAVAYVEKIKDHSHDGVKISVAIVGDHDRTTYSQCSMDLIPDGNVISSVNRLSAKKVLLTLNDTLEHDANKLKLVLADLQNCKFTAVNESFKEHFVVTSYRGSDKFDVLVSDRRVCKLANARCRISYDGLNITAMRLLDVDLDWKSLRVEYTPSGDFLISGLDTVGIFKFTLLDGSFGTRRDLLAIPNAKNMELMTSQFSICWIENPGNDKSVHCSQFDEDGELIFRKTFTYKEPVVLISLQHLTSNRSLLLAGKARCDNDWQCWNLFVTRVQSEMKIWSTQYTEHFDCSEGGDRRQRLIFAARLIDDAVLAEYVCDNANNFTFKHYVIDTTDR